ncbi:MAG TPA: FAD binding domain-containing protein [Trebonia sp.]|jgi:CO/xanthine dehydrogenase FAD-binding subunit|nr:FAD binding domain-containing protein [Trebonia sp.]
MTRSPYILRPRSVEEAVAAAAQYPEFALCAGGTALMTERNAGSRPAALGWLLLQDVTELHDYREMRDGRWRLGSLVSLARLGALTAIAPGLAEAARQAGSGQLRNAATLGGNVVGAQATSDLIPALLSLDATAEIASAGGTRTQPVEDFLVGPAQTTLAPGEILTAIIVDGEPGTQWYERVGAGRRAFTPLICALAARLDRPAGTARVAVADGARLAVRVRAAEELMSRADQADAFVAELLRAIRPADDPLAPASYRRTALAFLTRRAYAELAAAGR